MILSSFRFFEFDVVPVLPVAAAANGTCVFNGTTVVPKLRLQLSAMRRNKAYISVYVNTMSLLFNMVIPFAAMGVMNYVIYRVARWL